MDELVRLWEWPIEQDNYMIVGWQQWADAGDVSSGLPRYLIEHLGARRIGEIQPDGFYLFQMPGAHHLMRPQVRLKDGYREAMSRHRNEVFYADVHGKGLLIFEGEEPNQHEERYCDAILDIAKALNVRRVAAVGGVYGAMPFDKDREVSCCYSLRRMQTDLASYSLRFSNYEGGTTIGTFLVHCAERHEVEAMTMNAFAPAYEFSHVGLTVQAMRVDEDWKAWYDIMRRLAHMFQMELDLGDLRDRSRDLIEAWGRKVDELEQRHPELHVKAYLESVAKEFEEKPFIPLDKAWDELGDLLRDS
jgi:proteasome assembly chaperone (PAC2) family protein